jgi:uncharacterized protein (DUF58 family)
VGVGLIALQAASNKKIMLAFMAKIFFLFMVYLLFILFFIKVDQMGHISRSVSTGHPSAATISDRTGA